MIDNKISSIPEQYKHAVKKELQGRIVEVSYSSSHYINRERKLVTDQKTINSKIDREVVTGKEITKLCNVYLPPNYDINDKDTRYNTLYLLHGVGGNRYEWLNGSGSMDENYVICNIFDNLIANGDIEPVIVVFPEGRSAFDWRDSSFNPLGTNLLGFYYFDYELRYDLIPFIESNYNTYSNMKDISLEGISYNRLHRAIAGLSMGGMQTMNLILGGYRCDAVEYTNTTSDFKNGLDITVPAPGMVDLFAYVGAFSNAPTSSEGTFLGASLAASGYKLALLYMSCGDADEVAYPSGYLKSNEGLAEAAGDNLLEYHKVVLKDGRHDFNVWNHGAYNFIRLTYHDVEVKE